MEILYSAKGKYIEARRGIEMTNSATQLYNIIAVIIIIVVVVVSAVLYRGDLWTTRRTRRIQTEGRQRYLFKQLYVLKTGTEKVL